MVDLDIHQISIIKMKDRDNYNIFGNGNDRSKESSNKANIKYSIFSGKEIDRPIKIENKNQNQNLNQINEIIQQGLKDIENKDDDLSGKEFKTQILKKGKKKKISYTRNIPKIKSRFERLFIPYQMPHLMTKF